MSNNQDNQGDQGDQGDQDNQGDQGDQDNQGDQMVNYGIYEKDDESYDCFQYIEGFEYPCVDGLVYKNNGNLLQYQRNDEKKTYQFKLCNDGQIYTYGG